MHDKKRYRLEFVVRSLLSHSLFLVDQENEIRSNEMPQTKINQESVNPKIFFFFYIFITLFLFFCIILTLSNLEKLTPFTGSKFFLDVYCEAKDLFTISLIFVFLFKFGRQPFVYSIAIIFCFGPLFFGTSLQYSI